MLFTVDSGVYLVDERKVVFDDFLAVRSVEIGLKVKGGGRSGSGCKIKVALIRKKRPWQIWL